MKVNKKVCIIITLVVIILSAISIFIFNFVKDMKKDRQDTLMIMETIKEKYKLFSPMVEEFTTKRTNFYNMKDEKMFLESINSNRDDIQTFMDDYEAFILKVHNDNIYLQEHCQIKYFDKSVNNTCNLFKQGYEAVMNYYMNDIGVYNEIINIYNNWLIENNMEGSMEKLTFELYDSYIDYDQDGSFLGGK